MYFEAPDGTRLFYKDWGTGPVLLFCHGNNLNSDCWEQQMVPLMMDGFRCIAYDRRGHGRSEAPASGYDFDTMAGDLAALMEHLDLRDVTLAAHSSGACDVARYLSRYGSSRVAKSVLIGTATPYAVQTADNPDAVPPQLFETWIAQMIADRPNYYRENAGPFFGPDVSADMLEHGIRMAMTSSLVAAIGLVRAQSLTDLRADMRSFDMPTLIVHGRHDGPVRATAIATHLAIPHSRLVWYEDGYHGLPMTHPGRLNSDLRAFVLDVIERPDAVGGAAPPRVLDEARSAGR